MCLLAFTLALAACGGGADGGAQPRSYTLQQLAVSEVRVISQENLSVEIKAVNDSRCPETVECFWAGQATVDLVVHLDSLTQSLTLTLGPMADSQPTTFAGFQFILDKLLPLLQLSQCR